MCPRGVFFLTISILAAACAGRVARPELVPLRMVDSTIARDMRYATARNFVGVPIDGYGSPTCLLTEPAARALRAVQDDLARRGLGLQVFDCYRPQRAVDRFVRWAADPGDQHTKATYYPRVDKTQLFERGYIAARSSHSRGSTVDVTVVRVDDGRVALDMGTPFDFFDPRSHGDSDDVTPQQKANRLLLREAMVRRGFVPYPAEWWHFTLAQEPYPGTYFDVPVRRIGN